VAAVIFYELPPGGKWQGLSRLVSHVMSRGRVVVLIGSKAEMKELSACLWELPAPLMVPHGIADVDADDIADPVIIAAGRNMSSRDVVVMASPLEPEWAESPELIVESVSRDAEERKVSRIRYRQYKDLGLNPKYVRWEEWGVGKPGDKT